MNIINNRPNLDLGTNLNFFKKTTSAMSSKDRGFALDDLQFVKDIHNSFSRSISPIYIHLCTLTKSREIDHMVVDLRLKEDFQADKKKRAPQKKKKKKGRKKVTLEDDDNGFHFIAYVPSGGQVWKLDGTEALPRTLGKMAGGRSCEKDILTQIHRTISSSRRMAPHEYCRHTGTNGRSRS